jgi:hypothetical protein
MNDTSPEENVKNGSGKIYLKELIEDEIESTSFFKDYT